MAERIFGHIPGVAVGTLFANRRELSTAGVHRPVQAGICGSGKEGAESIVVSGGYRDDEDHGDLVIYTGHGGNDPATKKQVSHQEFHVGNKGLAISCDSGLPVRLVRGANGDPAHSPTEGYRYDGLFTVTRYWPETGLDGFRIWRFELCRFEDPTESTGPSVAEDHLAGSTQPAPREQATVQRIVRNTSIGTRVKALHDYRCQICETRIETLAGPYAEAAHIRPLGRPHNGPDVESNVLCLCPNCHVEFDRLAIYVSNDFVYSALTGERTNQLRTVRRHEIDARQLEYQKGLCQTNGNQ